MREISLSGRTELLLEKTLPHTRKLKTGLLGLGRELYMLLVLLLLDYSNFLFLTLVFYKRINGMRSSFLILILRLSGKN